MGSALFFGPITILFNYFNESKIELTPIFVNVSINAVKERVIRLSSERLRKAKRGQIALTERQMQIVEFINQNGKIANKDIREMFKISH
jgi:predicted HTH transcriptional regulator